jgi:mono/diheme cytochrome c family protein
MAMLRRAFAGSVHAPAPAERGRASSAARRRGLPLALGGALALGFAATAPGLGCASSTFGATDADLARGKEATSGGAALFARECVRCHGRHGEGIADAPAILGPGALPEYPRENPPSGVRGVQDPQQAEIAQQTRRTGALMRGTFRNAWDVYVFVKGHLGTRRFPTPAARDEHDWSLVTFLLAADGAQLPAGGVTADNANSLPVPRR